MEVHAEAQAEAQAELEAEAQAEVAAAEEAVAHAMGGLQWVGGDNAALNYRGNPLKREKIWLQRGSVTYGYKYYYYTGIQWKVVRAQTDWAQCPEIRNIAEQFDVFCTAVGAREANQAIITRYRDGDHFIGKHFDKAKSIAPSEAGRASLITVIKIGEIGRRFNLYDLMDVVFHVYSQRRSHSRLHRAAVRLQEEAQCAGAEGGNGTAVNPNVFERNLARCA